jgi:hypothetical protein
MLLWGHPLMKLFVLIVSPSVSFLFEITITSRVCGKKFFVGVGCGVWGVGFYPFSGGQLPNFQGKSPGILPPITPRVSTF